jgi:hypothetical protein
MGGTPPVATPPVAGIGADTGADIEIDLTDDSFEIDLTDRANADLDTDDRRRFPPG